MPGIVARRTSQSPGGVGCNSELLSYSASSRAVVDHSKLNPGFLAFWLSGFLAFWLSGFLAFWLVAGWMDTGVEFAPLWGVGTLSERASSLRVGAHRLWAPRVLKIARLPVSTNECHSMCDTLSYMYMYTR